MGLVSRLTMMLMLLSYLPASRMIESNTTSVPNAFSDGFELDTSVNYGDISSSNSTVDNDIIVTTSSTMSPFDIHHGSVSEATFNYFSTVADYIQYPLYIVAVVSNVFNVVVYCQKGMESPTSTILIALCSCEALYVISSFVPATLRLVYGENSMNSRIYLNFGLYASLYVTVCLRRSGFCFTFLVSAERFIAVAFPLRAKSTRLVKHPAVVCLFILVSVSVFHIFSPMKYIVIPYTISTNSTAYRFQFSAHYLKDKVHFENVSMASKFIFVYFVLMGCLFFNLLIVMSLNRHKKVRETMQTTHVTDANRREKQTTVTLMASTFVYVLLALPANTNSIISNLRDDYRLFNKEHFLFLLMARVGSISGLVSNCTNFIFYILLSTKFRQTFSQTFLPCMNKRLVRKGEMNMEIYTSDTRFANIF